MGYGRSFSADELFVLPTKLLPSPSIEAARKQRNKQQQQQLKGVSTFCWQIELCVDTALL
jgi:hypothetical protein